MKEFLHINGKSYDFSVILKQFVNVPLIEGLEVVGLRIPNFCYNQELSIAGNCRMCFIESKNALKPIVACSVSLKSYLNSSIFTESPLILKSRENILEFLLLNHPIDCTICDQAGECDLQDHSLIHGVTNKRFYSYKRAVDDKYVGPVIITSMTKCIHCTRCIRFSSEISGLKEFGIFGRGVSSEVGVYKLSGRLTSELSGNLIDLCPVGSITKKRTIKFNVAVDYNKLGFNFNLIGALTGRPYPFTIRVWEHLFKTTIDSTDAFGQSLRVGIAYNKIRRILPNLTTSEGDTPWINDRTRFSFEGLPSGNALKFTLVKKKVQRKLTEIIILIFYFYDHLSTHLLEIGSFVFIFGTSTSLELISLLLFTFSKYSFLKIKTSAALPQSNDFECNFQLNSSTIKLNNLLKSDLCILIGVNTRYEGSYLNLKLRKRYLKSNFSVVSLSSLLDLTFPTFLLGSTLKKISFIVGGNSLISQTFKNANYPILILNSDYFRRFDNKSYSIFIEILKSYSCFIKKDWNGINTLNSSLNDVGTNLLNRFLVVKPADLIDYSTFYFFNSPLYVVSMKKSLELKVLNFLVSKNIKTFPKVAFHQSSGIENSFWATKKLQKKGAIKSCFFVTTKNFYDGCRTYINAEGFIKKSVSVLVSNLNLKNDWKFLRRVFGCTKKNILFTKNIKNKKQVFYKSKNALKFKNYLALHFLPLRVFTRLLFYQLSENRPLTKKTCEFFSLLYKNFDTKIKFWLQDFYLGNRDLYSRNSKTMVKCSAYARLGKINFSI